MPESKIADAHDNRGFYRAEIMTLQQITANLEIIAGELRDNRKAMMDMAVNVAKIEERQVQNLAFKEDLAELEAKVDEIVARNARQDGAFNFVKLLKEFAPWIATTIAVGWDVFMHAFKK